MEVFVYLPKSEKDKAELAQRVSAVHAEFVLDHVKRLSCSVEQKAKIIEAVQCLTLETEEDN